MAILERMEDFIRSSLEKAGLRPKNFVIDAENGLGVEIPEGVQEEAWEAYVAGVAKAYTTGKTVIGNLPTFPQGETLQKLF